MDFDPVSLINQTQESSPSIQLNCNIDPSLAAASGSRTPPVKSDASVASTSKKSGHFTHSPSQSPKASTEMIASTSSDRSNVREGKRARPNQRPQHPSSPTASWNDQEEEQQDGAEESLEIDYSQAPGMINQGRYVQE